MKPSNRTSSLLFMLLSMILLISMTQSVEVQLQQGVQYPFQFSNKKVEELQFRTTNLNISNIESVFFAAQNLLDFELRIEIYIMDNLKEISLLTEPEELIINKYGKAARDYLHIKKDKLTPHCRNDICDIFINITKNNPLNVSTESAGTLQYVVQKGIEQVGKIGIDQYGPIFTNYQNLNIGSISQAYSVKIERQHEINVYHFVVDCSKKNADVFINLLQTHFDYSTFFIKVKKLDEPCSSSQQSVDCHSTKWPVITEEEVKFLDQPTRQAFSQKNVGFCVTGECHYAVSVYVKFKIGGFGNSFYIDVPIFSLTEKPKDYIHLNATTNQLLKTFPERNEVFKYIYTYWDQKFLPVPFVKLSILDHVGKNNTIYEVVTMHEIKDKKEEKEVVEWGRYVNDEFAIFSPRDTHLYIFYYGSTKFNQTVTAALVVANDFNTIKKDEKRKIDLKKSEKDTFQGILNTNTTDVDEVQIYAEDNKINSSLTQGKLIQSYYVCQKDQSCLFPSLTYFHGKIEVNSTQYLSVVDMKQHKCKEPCNILIQTTWIPGPKDDAISFNLRVAVVKHGELSPWAIVGIVLGSVVFVAALGFLTMRYLRKKKIKETQYKEAEYANDLEKSADDEEESR